MAYVEKYYSRWIDHTNTIHEIKLKKDGASAGSTEIPNVGLDGCTISRKASKNSSIDIVLLGTELTYTFYIEKSSLSLIDAIFESDFREWKVEKYYDSVLQWVGWLRPDNFSRNYIPVGGADGIFQINLAATDALATLKEIEFVDFTTGYQYTDRVSILTTLKRALAHLELDLNLDIQLGTYCTNDSLMTSTQLAFDKVLIDNSRYTKITDGLLVNESCFTIIEKALKGFNVHIFQQPATSGAVWRVVNAQEKNSHTYPVTWSTLAVGTRTARNLILDITNYDFTSKGTVSKIRPFKRVGVTYRDRNIQDNLLTNGDFDGGSIAGWSADSQIDNFTSNTYQGGYELQCEFGDAIGTIPTTPPNFWQTLAEAIVLRSETAEIVVQYKVRCAGISMKAGSYSDFQRSVLVKPQIRKTTITGDILVSVPSGPWSIDTNDNFYQIKEYRIPITENDDYFLEFIIDKGADNWSDYDSIDIRFDEINMFVDYSDGIDITFDRYYNIWNIDNIFTDNHEVEIFHGDSGQDNDIGSFQIWNGSDNIRTATWSRYGKSENASISTLFAKNILANHSRFKNYIRLAINDPNQNILMDSILRMTQGSETRDYQITSFSIRYFAAKVPVIECELSECLNTDVGVTIDIRTMSTIDGSGSSSSVLAGGGVSVSVISDAVTALDKTWSSSKISTEIGLKEPAFTKNTAFNKNFGTAIGDVVSIGATLGNDLAVMTNASGALITSAVTSTELGYVSGVTSSIQTQIDSKVTGVGNGAVSTILDSNLTVNRALISNASGKVAISSSVTSTELGYLSGASSNIQTQLDTLAADKAEWGITPVALRAVVTNAGGTLSTHPTTTYTEIGYLEGLTGNLQTQIDGKAATVHTHVIGDVTGLQTAIDSKEDTITGAATTVTTSDLTANRALISNASGKIAISSSVTSTELGYLSGATSNVQTQLDSKAEWGIVPVALRAVVTNAGGTLSTHPTVTYTEIGYLEGATSNIQTQIDGKASITHTHVIGDVTGLQTALDAKQATITGAATTITASNLTANRALISNASGKVAISSSVTSTQLGYLSGVTSDIQTQLDASAIWGGTVGTLMAVVTDSSGNLATHPTTTYSNIGYLENSTGNIQTQLNGKEDSFSKNSAFNKNFGGSGSATTVSRTDHTHSGVYEPVFTKNSAFNKNFGASVGDVVTIGATIAPNRAAYFDGSGSIRASAVTNAELSYLDGVTQNIQTQLGNKLSTTPDGITFSGSGETAQFYLEGNDFISMRDLNGTYGAYGWFHANIVSGSTIGITSTISPLIRGRLYAASDGSYINLRNYLDDDYQILRVKTPVNANDAATKAYADTAGAGVWEPVFTKNSAFNKSFASTAGSVPAISGDLSGGAEHASYLTTTGKIARSALVSKTELEYLNGVTSNIQTQLNAKASTGITLQAVTDNGSSSSNTIVIQTSGEQMILKGNANGDSLLTYLRFQDNLGADQAYLGYGGASHSFLDLYQDSGNDGIRFYSNGTEAIRIASDGDVSIGQQSASEKLDVSGKVRAQGFVGDTLDNATIPSTNITLYDGYGIKGNRSAVYMTNYLATGQLRFGIGGHHGTNLKMIIRDDGDIGIGQEVPTEKLEVAGNILANNGAAGYMRVYNNASEYTYVRPYGVEVYKSEAYFRNSYPNGNIRIETNNGSSNHKRIEIEGATNKMHLYSHDGVMFSTIQPVTGNYGSFQVDANASGGYEGYSIGGRAVFMHNNTTTTGIFNDVDNHWLFYAIHGAHTAMYHDGIEKFRTSSTGVSVTGTGVATVNWTVSSDARIKKNIRALEVDVVKFMSIDAVLYNRVDLEDKEKTHVGFIAQNVKKAYPELVEGSEGEEMLSVNYAQMIVPLWNQVKNLTTQLNELKNQLMNK